MGSHTLAALTNEANCTSILSLLGFRQVEAASSQPLQRTVGTNVVRVARMKLITLGFMMPSSPRPATACS